MATKIPTNKKIEAMKSYALTGSYNKTAKEVGINDKTVKNIIERNKEEYTKIYEQKKEQFIEKTTTIIDKALDKLEKELDNNGIPVNNLTTVIGTLYDKRALAKGESTGNTNFSVDIKVIE